MSVLRNSIVAAGCSLFAMAAVAATPTQRIIGGCKAEQSTLDWTIAVGRKGSASEFDGTFCGATLVDPNWAVTAAHCVNTSTRVLSPREIELYVGTTTLDGDDGTTHQVSAIYSHPAFNNGNLVNDIALLKLSEPSTAPTARLATIKPGAGLNALTAGWGRTNAQATNGLDLYPRELRQVNVTTVSNSSCYPGLAYSQLCAGEIEGGKDSCSGDSGGPLVLKSQGEDTLVGVVSYGYGCAQADHVGVYTSVASFRNWMHEASDGAIPLPSVYSENYTGFNSGCDGSTGVEQIPPKTDTETNLPAVDDASTNELNSTADVDTGNTTQSPDVVIISTSSLGVPYLLLGTVFLGLQLIRRRSPVVETRK